VIAASVGTTLGVRRRRRRADADHDADGRRDPRDDDETGPFTAPIPLPD
jgi:inner membrane transporter RhtA